MTDKEIKEKLIALLLESMRDTRIANSVFVEAIKVVEEKRKLRQYLKDYLK